jgi:uncharacterized membrane protein YccF (DUF307 family)
MRLILNVLWFIFGGFFAGLGWILAGVIMAITIIGLPWTPSAFRMASFSFWPFGRVVADFEGGSFNALLNIVWFIFAGWWLALGHVMIAFAQAITIIGIPFAWQHIKLAGLALMPVGKDLVRT